MTLFSTLAPQAPARAAPPATRIAAALLLVQFAAMWAAFFILAPAIDWPVSLDAPPAVILPLILEQAGPVFAGYASYLTHALLIAPLAIVMGAALRMTPVLGATAAAFGVLAALTKALGIVRWLFLMPGLASAYVDPATSETGRIAVATVYQAFNAYAGGVGEVLGVGPFAGIWTVCVAVALLRLGARRLGWAGFAAAALLFSTLPSVLGIEAPILLTLSAVLWQLWTAALAIWLLRDVAR